ncbi:MAG: hypothetical protein GDA49_06690 [Rhodospirillales bacterium]|nr:hypothetical protein [Rhodospirillales bacterium]
MIERYERHQRDVLSKAPDGLNVAMLRETDRETLAAALAEDDYLISERRGTVNASLMDAAPDLKLILRLDGMSHDLDLAAAREHGVIVCRRSQEGPIRVAEFVVLQMLALLRRVMECREVALEAGDDWAERRTTETYDR